MVSLTLAEDLRKDLHDNLQTLLTYGGGNTIEANVVQEFEDNDKIYPMLVIDIVPGRSTQRYLGTARNTLISFELSILTAEPTLPNHVITCEDTVIRSGRRLVEYLALKVGNYLDSTYQVPFKIITDNVDIQLDMDFEEREGLFKSMVTYEIFI